MNSINLEKLEEIILKNLENKTEEAKRVFHGRGNFYKDFNYLSVDSLGKILFATFHDLIEEEKEKSIIELLNKIAVLKDFDIFIVQRKYKKEGLFEAIKGKYHNLMKL